MSRLKEPALVTLTASLMIAEDAVVAVVARYTALPLWTVFLGIVFVAFLIRIINKRFQ